MAKSPKPDILLIVLDTLRADRLSCYGHPQTTTPNLDAFAAKSTLFERAISPAQWTIPAHGSLFTGEYPTTHLTHQIYDTHSPAYTTLAEHLSAAGYNTVGFCNNPLLGVVNNGLDRGFQEFYNYGGTVPQRPQTMQKHGKARNQLVRTASHLLEKINEPAQHLLTRTPWILNMMLHPWLVSMWEKRIHFKGNTQQSITDLIGYLKARQGKRERRPIFTYLNLMQTHLPYTPPKPFIDKFAPIFQEERAARDFMRSYNNETYRWITPVTEPFTTLQHETLNAMYNAEVAYEDALLTQLLAYLDKPKVRDNTLVIITADHGEGLDHHNFVGHSLVTYEDLIRVPLIIRYPPQYAAGQRVSAPVSTRRIFHTVLHAAGVHTTAGHTAAVYPAATKPQSDQKALLASEVHTLSLSNITLDDLVLSEAYPPLTMVNLMESRNPEAIETFRCRAVRRAIYAPPPDHNYKLITIDGHPDELFDVSKDPGELRNLLHNHDETAAKLKQLINAQLAQAQARRITNQQPSETVHLEGNKKLQERLRGLGYIN